MDCFLDPLTGHAMPWSHFGLSPPKNVFLMILQTLSDAVELCSFAHVCACFDTNGRAQLENLKFCPTSIKR